MSSTTSSDYSESGIFSGKKTMRLSEKPKFSQTCSLLSQYLKQKGSFGDLMSLGVTTNLEVKGKNETCPQTVTTMDLLPNLEISSETSNRSIHSMDLFPQHTGFVHHPSSMPENNSAAAAAATATAQMTIFYGGKVLVFDDFPAEKAKEVMLLASNGSSQKFTSFVSTSGNDQLNQSTFATSNSNLVPTSVTNQEQRLQMPSRPIVSDLPIARKASLHRFLEKRKDRISAKAPYPPVNNSYVISSKQAETKTWFGLASEALTSKQLELQL